MTTTTLYRCCRCCADDQPHIEANTHEVACTSCQTLDLAGLTTVEWAIQWDLGQISTYPDEQSARETLAEHPDEGQLVSRLVSEWMDTP